MFVASLVTLASFLVSQVAAHGGVTSYIINGQTYPGWQPYNSPNGQRSIGRPYSSYDPIMNAMDSRMSCNNNGQPSGGQLSANIRAGDKITARWGQWTHAEGPVMVYMARCPGSCNSANSNNLEWFKIDEAGLLSGSLARGQWGNGIVLKDLVWTSTIPAALADGEYLIRHELLALHQANTPQFYPECAQLIVTGGGGKLPSGQYLTRFPGAYSMSDPGVRVDIYSQNAPNIFEYKVPGPPVWNGQ
ncbi:cellulose-growth-specific protein [Coprinopsis cinerea okayama7|uniref:AA9 family lytic polysaccharide monooxygenase n=1 Tax=Coprinopsis cinerea (strain Okayama-7 / 130 / ATCC MYA-4618 / FGSC 9003) TaxID=240176 RepID=A8P3S3_COPC7|nr:cellulose-growth-specific protein [Coprinopsis cinerea okayama7\|eukprot:XP_001838602.1 cellulose-growth-specific protein [Coprinopsis cinerea okayama7\